MSEVGGLLATGSGDWQARIFKITGMDEATPQSTSTAASTTNTIQPSGAAKAPVTAAPISLSAAIARTISPLPPQAAAGQKPPSTQPQPQPQAAPSKQSTTEAQPAKVQPEATTTKENGLPSNANGAERSKEAQPSPASSSSATAKQSAPAPSKEVPAQQEDRPAVTSADAPSSPGAMKLDPPADSTATTDKIASKEGSAENGMKEATTKANGENKAVTSDVTPSSTAKEASAAP